jgi:hypothetical protein
MEKTSVEKFTPKNYEKQVVPKSENIAPRSRLFYTIPRAREFLSKWRKTENIFDFDQIT